MSQEWIEKLAGEIQHKSREGAESYARRQHRAAIVAEQGKTFFLALVMALEQNFTEIRSQLQGSAVSCETSLQRDSLAQARLTRSRFPWFDATLKHATISEEIVLEYVQDRGVAIDESLLPGTTRQTAHFSFQVDSADKLSIAESFGETQRHFTRPEDLARHIVELLFKV